MAEEEKTEQVDETPEKGGNYIAQAWLILLLAVCFGASLTGVQISLGEKIQQNKLNETFSQIPNLVPGSDTGKGFEIDGKIIYRAMSGDAQVGWVVPATGQGFADKVEILIGLDTKADKLTGLYVLDQKETPGLGNKIVEEDWQMQYVDKPTASQIEVIKAGSPTVNQIMAVTGATISSVAVTDLVNKTVAEIKDKLASNAK
ncbi:FMN-binding protein [bacterium]|nr:FMN-binding protein [bacterium]